MTTTVTTASSGPLIANGVTPIPFAFQAIAEDQIAVSRNGVKADPATYTVDLNDNGTGSVTPTSTWGSDTIYIYSDPDFEQPTGFNRFGAFYPDQINGPLDRLARQIVALKDSVARGALAPDIVRTGKYVTFDAEGNPIASSGTGADAGLRADIAAPTGSSLVGVTNPAGATTTIQRHIIRNYLEDIPGFVEGASGVAATNATVLNAQLALGRHFHMRPGALYRMAGVLMKATSGLTFEGGGTKPVFYMPAANFTRAVNVEAGRYAASGCGIRVFGGQNDAGIDGLTGTTPVNKVTLGGFIVQSEVSDNRNIVGVYVRNATDVTLSDLEVFGLPLGVGVQLDSVQGHSLVENLYVRDMYTNTTVVALVTNAPNTTGLGVGGNEVNSVGCEGITFRNIRIKNIMTGPAFQEANTKNDGDATSWTTQRANQSDGINVSGVKTRYCKFSDIDIDTVGEGMDIFGTDNQFTRASIRNADTFGVKFIHGGSRNQLDQIHLERIGLGGFIFNGTAVVACEDNRVSNFTVKTLNPNGIWSAGNGGGTSTGGATTYGASFVSSTFLAKNNKLVNGVIDGGVIGYLDNAGVGSKNYGLDIEVRNTASERILVQGATDGRVRQVGGTTFVKQVDAAGTVIA